MVNLKTDLLKTDFGIVFCFHFKKEYKDVKMLSMFEKAVFVTLNSKMPSKPSNYIGRIGCSAI